MKKKEKKKSVDGNVTIRISFLLFFRIKYVHIVLRKVQILSDKRKKKHCEKYNK